MAAIATGTLDPESAEWLRVLGAADARVSIRRRLCDFRGESRFISWAYAFVVFDRFGLDPVSESEWRQLVAELHRGVDQVLNERQRRVTVAMVLNGIPLDALVHELGSSRNAIYKTLYDARRKLRARLAASGHLEAA
jgi:RNA polymerase sigma-70 factor (ECF subfamily)